MRRRIMQAIARLVAVGFGRTITLIMAFVVLASMTAQAQGTSVNAQYTATPVPMDAQLGAVWSQATPYPIANKYGTSNYSAPTGPCNASSTLRALWDGAKLYVM